MSFHSSFIGHCGLAFFFSQLVCWCKMLVFLLFLTGHLLSGHFWSKLCKFVPQITVPILGLEQWERSCWSLFSIHHGPESHSLSFFPTHDIWAAGGCSYFLCSKPLGWVGSKMSGLLLCFYLTVDQQNVGLKSLDFSWPFEGFEVLVIMVFPSCPC